MADDEEKIADWYDNHDAITGKPRTVFTEQQAVMVDQYMSDHMYSHTISNSYANFACNIQCRTDALMRAVQKALDNG